MKNQYIYPAYFYREDNGHYSVDFPDFHAGTCGRTLEEAYAMAEDFLKGIIINMTEDNEQLPSPSSCENLKPDPDYIEGKTALLAIITVDKNECRNNISVKKTVSIPKWLSDEATKKRINYSRVLQDALKEKLSLA